MRTLTGSLWRRETGFTYIVVMITITLMGVAMTTAARQWKTMVQRELEADLLAKGIEIQTALALYSASKKSGRVMPGEFYPMSLSDLTRPPKPFLRKLYQDPMGHGEWQLVRAPTGGIMGVRSTSKSKPIKQSNFPLAVRHFQGKPTHADWIFQHPSPSMTIGLEGALAPMGFVPGQAPGESQPIPSDPTNAPNVPSDVNPTGSVSPINPGGVNPTGSVPPLNPNL